MKTAKDIWMQHKYAIGFLAILFPFTAFAIDADLIVLRCEIGSDRNLLDDTRHTQTIEIDLVRKLARQMWVVDGDVISADWQVCRINADEIVLREDGRCGDSHDMGCVMYVRSAGSATLVIDNVSFTSGQCSRTAPLW